MTKELQDLVWSILPKEFKEEVKKRYKTACRHRDLYSARGTMETLELLFGIHNLTSDAEGEEMLTVSRKRVQRRYHMAYKCKHSGLLSHDDVQFWKGWQSALDDLFGSKCLPDNVATSEPNVDSSHGNVESLEPKPVEPKYHEGDKFRFKQNRKQVHTVDHITEDGKVFYWDKDLEGMVKAYMVNPDYIEPYTEPEKNIAETRNLSQDRDKLFDNILKNSFSKERRLAIAVQMMQGLICAPLVPGVDPNPPAEQLAQAAFRLADALIAEAEKGGDK